MANGLEINLGDEVFQNLWESMPQEILDKINLLISLGKYALIGFIVYLVFLVVRQLIKFRDSRKLTLISKDIHEINKKLDLIIASKKVNKKEKKDKEK